MALLVRQNCPDRHGGIALSRRTPDGPFLEAVGRWLVARETDTCFLTYHGTTPLALSFGDAGGCNPQLLFGTTSVDLSPWEKNPEEHQLPRHVCPLCAAPSIQSEHSESHALPQRCRLGREGEGSDDAVSALLRSQKLMITGAGL